MQTFFKIVYQPYKWLFVLPAAVIITFLMGLIAIVTGLALNQNAVNPVAVLWARLCCTIIPLRVRVRGAENYVKNGSYVIVANHQSMVDIPVLHAHLRLNIKWIMKKELGRIPVFGTACRQLGCITVDRQNHAAALESIENAKKRLPDKASVVFFAEGTRSRDGRVMPFKKGAFRFARETGRPILPLTIRNSIRILPSDSLDLIPGTIDLIVHPPIHVLDNQGVSMDETIQLTRRIIADAV